MKELQFLTHFNLNSNYLVFFSIYHISIFLLLLSCRFFFFLYIFIVYLFYVKYGVKELVTPAVYLTGPICTKENHNIFECQLKIIFLLKS